MQSGSQPHSIVQSFYSKLRLPAKNEYRKLTHPKPAQNLLITIATMITSTIATVITITSIEPWDPGPLRQSAHGWFEGAKVA